MTFINNDSRVRADVVRLTEMRDTNGNVVLESYNQVYGLHWADIQPLSSNDRIASEQLKIKATHRIFPEPYLGNIVQVLDFFREGSNLYRVTGINDFRSLAYYEALHDTSGISEPSATLASLFFSFDSIGPGTYTFGSGTFDSVPTFAQAPDIIGLKTNDGDYYIDSITANGFRLVDRGLGISPLVTLYIWEKPVGAIDVNKWSFTGIGPGTYTYGTSPLTGVPSDFSAAPILYTQNNNDGDHYVTNKTATGFTIVDRGLGSMPSITVVILRS